MQTTSRREYYAQWREKNAEHARLYDKKRNHIRQKKDVQFLLKSKHRVHIHWALTRALDTSYSKHLGCTVGEFKKHLESQFQPNMTWTNRSLWHVDHKTPMSYFDLTDPKQAAKAFHFSNTQPLWSTENRVKGPNPGRGKRLGKPQPCS